MTRRWYEDGLCFECQRCGCCCGGRPGYVWVTDQEIKTIAEYCHLSEQEFFDRYLRKEGRRISLNECENYDCIFLEKSDAGGCRIYQIRPMQCRTWPFWKSNLGNRSQWESTTRNCPGVNRGRLYAAEEIRQLREDSPC